MVIRRPDRGPSRVAAAALMMALALGALLCWSCRDRRPGDARADNNKPAAVTGPGATTGGLLVITTGDTRAALETCS